jgi:hypothetical protein
MLKPLRRAPSMSRTGTPAGYHFPFRRLALCLDCDACFEIGAGNCRACGSDTWCTIARFLELRDEAVRPGQIIVVSRQRPRLYQRLRRAFAGNKSVQVVLDRREGERRRGGAAGQHADRRRLLDRRAVDEVRVIGWTVVRRAEFEVDARSWLG